MIKTIREINISQKRALVRADFNVGLDEEGKVSEDFRIRAALATINYLKEKGARIILMSHLDDPAGAVVENLRLNPVLEKLRELLPGIKIIKADDCVGQAVKDLAFNLKPGEILLLENLRFHKGEEENEEDFARELADLAEVYINDAFGVCHRNHASVVSVPKYLPKAMGLLLEKEIEVLSQLLENPAKPLLAIIGGKKVETKTKLINNLCRVADWVLVNNLITRELEEKKIALSFPEKIIKPVDAASGNFDIGPQTINLFKEKISLARTIFWNGPLGKFEEEEFSRATRAISQAIIASKAFSVIGGGETIKAINQLGFSGKFNHISTGGGAMLAFLSGEELLGIKALEE